MCFVFVFCPLFLFFVDCPNGGMPFTSIPHPPPSFSQARISITFHWGKRQKQRLCTGSTSLWHVLLIELASGAANPLFAADLYRLSLTAFCFRFTSLNSTFSSLSLFFSFFRTLLFIGRFFLKQFTVSVIYTYCNREIIFFFSLPLS